MSAGARSELPVVRIPRPGRRKDLALDLLDGVDVRLTHQLQRELLPDLNHHAFALLRGPREITPRALISWGFGTSACTRFRDYHRELRLPSRAFLRRPGQTAEVRALGRTSDRPRAGPLGGRRRRA